MDNLTSEFYDEIEQAEVKMLINIEYYLSFIRTIGALTLSAMYWFIIKPTLLAPSMVPDFLLFSILIYSFTYLFLEPYRRLDVRIVSFYSILADAFFVSLLIFFTGSMDSPLYSLLYILVVAFAFRLNVKRLWIVTVAIAFSYAALEIYANGYETEFDTLIIQSVLLFLFALVCTLFSFKNSQSIHKEIMLKKMAENLKETEQLKSNFIANISHEVRTPLNAIIGYSDLLNATTMNKEQKGYNEAVLLSGKHLMYLLNDVLDFSKIEAGTMSMSVADFSLRKVVDFIESIYLEKARTKGISLEVQLSGNVPEFINGDEFRLTQILINLIDNAVKFTRMGTVKLTVNSLNDDGEVVKIEFLISDTGPGITEDRKENIYNVFSKRNLKKEVGEGPGLGLAITRKLVSFMQGEIDFKTDLKKGTQFRVVLPFKQGYKTEINQETKQKGLFLNVLLAEDDKLNQVLTLRHLENWNCVTDLAENGQQVLEMIQMKDYDLVLMDIQMPVLDGISATKQIRQKLNLQTPIIAMTASSLKHEKSEHLAAGMNDHISKPFEAQELYELLKRYKTN